VGFDEGPMMGLARRYLGKSPCPRMLGSHAEEGLDEIRRLVDSFRIDCIVYHSIKFCANLHSVAGIIKNEFDAGVPVKLIESDMGSEIDGREISSFIKNLAIKLSEAKNGARR
jgi:benzoyl-CoA reductase/2-hydroxyglutaryl-CoA dehydratase subunit BcrC/BadD/HgdB